MDDQADVKSFLISSQLCIVHVERLTREKLDQVHVIVYTTNGPMGDRCDKIRFRLDLSGCAWQSNVKQSQIISYIVQVRPPRMLSCISSATILYSLIKSKQHSSSTKLSPLDMHVSNHLSSIALRGSGAMAPTTDKYKKCGHIYQKFLTLSLDL